MAIVNVVGTPVILPQPNVEVVVQQPAHPVQPQPQPQPQPQKPQEPAPVNVTVNQPKQ